MRDFNLTGPGKPELHYVIPPLERSPRVLTSVQQSSYLAISGPRQTGKTSLLCAIVDSINSAGWGRAVLVSCEIAGAALGYDEIDAAENLLLTDWQHTLSDMFPETSWPAVDDFVDLPPGLRFGAAFAAWAAASDKPLIFAIDEVDALARLPLVSLLQQIRASFPDRNRHFPHSIVLAGMRSLLHHECALGGGVGGIPFNIAELITVAHFSRDDIARLYDQHTAETGQRFSNDAIDRVWEQTRGQPWLVNAIARHCVSELVTDPSMTVESHAVEEAIRHVETALPIHLASLGRRLMDDRVLRVVAPAIAGGPLWDAPIADIRYVRELGILEELENHELVAANPIYARFLTRHLTEPIRYNLACIAPTWCGPDGAIDLDRLGPAFLEFWTQKGRTLDPMIPHREIVPHIVLIAWLYRVANDDGRVDCDWSIARGRLDILLRYRDLNLPIEVKVHRDDSGDPVPSGIEHLDGYCAGLNVDRAWLVLFDQRTGASDSRLESEEVVTAGGRRVLVVRA